MYAIIEAGGKQYKVSKDSVIDVEKLARLLPSMGKPEGSGLASDKPEGDGGQPNSRSHGQSHQPMDEITFDNVLMVANDNEVKIGAPFVLGAKVLAEVVRNFKDRKVLAFKFRRRKSSKSKKGHRQQLTKVRIKEILLSPTLLTS